MAWCENWNFWKSYRSQSFLKEGATRPTAWLEAKTGGAVEISFYVRTVQCSILEVRTKYRLNHRTVSGLKPPEVGGGD